jgi:LacI family transcriptional regulator, galactose operon repressor
MTVTMAVVAARAGVSKSTVSRFVNGRGGIDELTAARIRAVIEELGYVPSARAVDLARGSTRTVGILVPSLTWPWIGEVLQGVADAVESEGYSLLLFTGNRGSESARRFSAQVAARSFDGLLAIEPEGMLEYLADLYRRGLPVVLIDDRGQQPGFPTVATTNRAGGRAAAEHLLDLGRTRPLVLTGPLRFGCCRERCAGFADAFAAAGLAPDPTLVSEGDFTYPTGQRLTAHALHDGHDFDSVFAHNDVMAAAALAVLREAGRRVPDDVAVIGFDDLPLATQTEPPLTAVHQPVGEMGQAAARALIDHLQGTPLGLAPVVIPTTLAVRASTVAPKPVLA